MTAGTVDVVIVAHNAGDWLVPAVHSAAEQAGEMRVWIVDAESTDDSVQAASVAFPLAHVLRVPNEGFSASNNRGIEATSDAWVLLLNPDAELQPGALERLLATAGTGDSIAIAAPLVTGPGGEVQPASFGRFPTFWRRVGTAVRRLAGGDRPKAPASTADVDWVTGACMLVRREAIADAGPMDEGFFLYFEDVEWCHRMRDHGWRVVLEPAARCVHHLGKTSAPTGVVARAYRESFYRYCDLYGLWGLKAAGRIGAGVRRLFGGRV